MNWKKCQEFIRERKIDYNMILSLEKQSNNLLRSMKAVPLEDYSASSKVSMIYESIRQLAEALTLLHEFEIMNHECYVYFFKEILKMNN